MIIVRLRFHKELNDFLPLEKQKICFEYAVASKTAIKDVIESVGVPHTEIDLILVNNKSVNFTYQVKDNDYIAVYPVFEPFDISNMTRLRLELLHNPRFILDVHLGKLARYLRLLGFDVAYDNHFTDTMIASQSHQKNKIVLTRDVGLLKNKIITYGYCVRQTDPKKQIVEVLNRFNLYKKIHPFTRCLECNGILEKIDKEKIIQRIPLCTQKYYQNFMQCHSCQKIYWKGTHYHKLKKWVANIIPFNL